MSPLPRLDGQPPAPPPPVPGVRLGAGGQPVQQQEGPSFIPADGFETGPAMVGDHHALVFVFNVNGGPITPIALGMTDVDAVQRAREAVNRALDATEQQILDATVEDEVPEVVKCSGCGQRIFGDLIKVGQCLACQKENEELPDEPG